MKSLAEQMRNHDREQMSRMAHNLPEQYQECAPVEQVAQVFNKLFNELRAAFPASMANFRTQEDLNEFRRQWLLAFQENGIHTMAQVDAGMRIARRQERPFLPSPGQFVAWCKQSGGALGVNVDQVIAEYWDWRNRSFEFISSEQFPWSQPVMYHICVELRHRSTERQLTHGDRHLPCISCGRHHDGQYHAGHFRTTGANPELRFDEDNCHRQCAPCNNHLSGNLISYRPALIAKIGQVRFDALMGPHELPKWKRDDYIRIRDEYRAKLKELKKQEAA